MTARQGFRYIDAQGGVTLDGVRLFDGIFTQISESAAEITAMGLRVAQVEADLTATDGRLAVAEGKLAAIALVAAPTGGLVIDDEARAAITAIITA